MNNQKFGEDKEKVEHVSSIDKSGETKAEEGYKGQEIDREREEYYIHNESKRPESKATDMVPKDPRYNEDGTLTIGDKFDPKEADKVERETKKEEEKKA